MPLLTVPIRSIPLGGGAPTFTMWADRGILWRFDAAKWAGKVWYLEAYARAVAGTVGARLYDKTIGVRVVPSELVVAAPSFTRMRSAPIPLVDGHDYVAQTGHFSGASGEIYGCRLVPIG